MTGSVALDVVIGLVFIYLLYSLFATVIMEIVNSFFGLRARNLRYTMRRMLMDEKEFGTKNNLKKKFFRLIINNILKISGKAYNLMRPELFNDFYNQPSIKYLGGGGLWNKPSYITSQNFSKALMDSLKLLGDETIENPLERIKNGIEKVGQLPSEYEVLEHKDNNQITWMEETSIKTNKFFADKLLIDTSSASPTQKHLKSLLEDANNDLQKFKVLLEQWFDDTMERSTGWFKRRIQHFLFLIGFILALSFNADTLNIIKKLSNDPDAREQLVAHASNYTKDNEALIEKINNLKKESTGGQSDDSLKTEESIREIIKSNNDSLRKISQTLQVDIDQAQDIIASNWHIPNTIINDTTEDAPKDYTKHSYKLIVLYMEKQDDGKLKEKEKDTMVTSLVHKSLDLELFEKYVLLTSREEVKKGKINVSKRKYKWSYVFASKGLNFMHLWGFILTALAISLGSPFWFDLLNRLIKLRSSIKPDQRQNGNANTNTAETDGATLINRVG